MMINPISIIQGISNLVSTVKPVEHKDLNSTLTEKTSSLTNKYDVNNMSLAELKTMFQELYDSGKLSSGDAMNLSSEKLLQQFSGLNKDSKVDMLQLFQQQLESMKSNPGAKDQDLIAQAVNILEGVKAASGRGISTSV